jgi:hypothetical protein
MNRINFILEKIKFKSGEGRWSWFLSSTIASILFRNSKKYEFIFTTGGPASAHLTGLFLAKLLGKKVICEFQDPLSGKDIGRNFLSQVGLKFFERFIINFSDCTIYCTENAMIEARVKYIKHTKKIYFVYPGSNIVDTITSNPIKTLAVETNILPKKINITYLGSLYQTRNLDTLMQAIDELISEGKPISTLLEINLYGNINSDIKNRILNFKHKVIRIHGLVDRDSAMNMAHSADVLLLIQNTDDRSIVTIPFKTYDYLHTGKLIFGLIYRNDELEKMLFSHGHLVCQANDVNIIKHHILNLTEDLLQYTSNIKKSIYTPALAVEQMINLINAS